MTTQGYTEEIEFVEEGEHVFYITGDEDVAVLPKDGLSDYCQAQLRELTEG